MQKRKMPNVLVLLFCLVVIAAVATYIIPSGEYTRFVDEAQGIAKIDPGSFQFIEGENIGVLDIFISIVQGFNQTAGIAIVIFAANAALHMIQKTGALDSFIVHTTTKSKGKRWMGPVIIALSMSAFSFCASVGILGFGETVAFIPIFIALALALGYDALVGLAMCYVAIGMGLATATINPFTVGIAQNYAQLPVNSGLDLRVVIYLVMMVIAIGYVVWYGERIKRNPAKSIIYDLDYSGFTYADAQVPKLNKQGKMTIGSLVATIVILGWGLTSLGWGMNEIAAVFLILSVVIAVIHRYTMDQGIHLIVEGFAMAMTPVLILALAKAISIVLIEGSVLDSIIYYATTALEGIGVYASSYGMLILQTLLNFVIPSGSGQAVATMPLMIPIADILGISRQLTVLIYQFGDGFSNLIYPTSFVLIACEFAKIPLSRYYRWFLPLFAMAIVVQIVSIFVAIQMNYGPF